MKPAFSLLLAGAHWPARLIASLGAALCLALTFVICARLQLTQADLPVIVAPLGASAVLVFAVPASPLAQPWSVVGGNVISAMVGVAAYLLIPSTALAAGVAVGGAILAMSLLRCLHPPGGAAALTAVIGGSGIHAAGWMFALAPVGINSLALIALGICYHRATGQRYPHRAVPAAAAAPPGLHATDIDAALADLHETFDIAPADLEALLIRAEAHAAARRSGSTSGARPATPGG